MFDVHELCAHPSRPEIVAAAAAVGLCVSQDQGKTWKVLSEGPLVPNSLAVAMTQDEALFSVQDGPFAARSQLWRWRIDSGAIEVVRDGLPEWLQGKIDTNQIAAGKGGAAFVDGEGNLWLRSSQGSEWKQIAGGLPYAMGIAVLQRFSELPAARAVPASQPG